MENLCSILIPKKGTGVLPLFTIVTMFALVTSSSSGDHSLVPDSSSNCHAGAIPTFQGVDAYAMVGGATGGTNPNSLAIC